MTRPAAARRGWRRTLRVLAAVLGALLVAGAGYAGLVLHRSRAVIVLPAPPGRYAVGRVEDTASDPARGGRRLSVWTWYPAVAGTGAPAGYAPGPWSALAIGLPLGETRLDRVRDPARERAVPAVGAFPVVALAPGMGFAAPQYAVLAENLASRGYVVVGVTPTGSANVTVLDGHVVGPTAQGNPSSLSGDQSARDRALAAPLLARWAADLRFAADGAGQLAASSVLAGHVDPARRAYVGHSFGGAAALAACHDDPACGAAADLDGALYGAVALQGLHVPVLLVGHDGSCVPGDCSPSDAADRADVAVARAFAAASTGGVRRVEVPGSGHLDFSDDGVLYWAWPLRRFLGLGPHGGVPALRRTADAVAATLGQV